MRRSGIKNVVKETIFYQLKILSKVKKQIRKANSEYAELPVSKRISNKNIKI